MTSITWSNDVDPIKNKIFGFPKSMAILSLRRKLTHLSFHNLIGLSLEILNLCSVLKNHVPENVKHGKAFLYSKANFRACALQT